MNKLEFRTIATCAFGAMIFVVAACGSNGSVDAPISAGPDAGEGGTLGCTANTKECVSPTLARVCPADGAGWLAVSCPAGEVCANGSCAPDTNVKVACTPGAGSCTSTTSGVRCRADGQGYDAITCPAATTCTGSAQCAGACVVGESYCVAPGVLATCADGNTLAQTACGGADLCVPTGSAPVRTAACKPAQCRPDANGCDFVCGDRVNAAADQTKSMSYCQATPAGYKWSVVACTSPQSCDPTGGRCNGNQDSMAACRSACTPGDQRCTADASGYQTCDASGQWSATTTACTATATAQQLVCQPKPQSPGQVVCGDLLCARGYDGVCDATGKIRLCDATGRVSAAATACGSGTCRSAGQPIAGLAPGKCQTDCVAGETECTAPGANSYRTCIGGVWSATTTTCGAATSCFAYADPVGLRKTVCGDCAPGTHQCQGAAIQTCSATGTWSASATCAVGLCKPASNGLDAGCVAQCVPGASVCAGGAKAVPGIDYARATDSEGTCTANGLLPAAPTACAAGTACRNSATGVAIGCVTCVGTNVVGGNEFGFTDSRCTDATGAFPGNPPDSATQVCGAANTWPVTATGCPGGQQCSQTQPGFRCRGNCPDPFDYGGTCTASGLASANPGFAVTCATLGQTTVSCGTTPDCCSGECRPTGGTVPAPAYCQ
jgi:hypothetical protein